MAPRQALRPMLNMREVDRLDRLESVLRTAEGLSRQEALFLVAKLGGGVPFEPDLDPNPDGEVLNDQRLLWLAYRRLDPPRPTGKPCASCNQSTVLPVILGMPCLEDLEAANAGHALIGGDVFPDDLPILGWACRDCGKETGQIDLASPGRAYTASVNRAIKPWLGFGLGPWPILREGV